MASGTKKRKKRNKCFSGIGGQAVLEGIMMKNKDRYSVAVRRADGTIAVDIESCHESWRDKKITQIPFVRGIFNFANSLILGIRSLNYSAEIYGEEETSNTAAADTADKSVSAENPQAGDDQVKKLKKSDSSKDFSGTVTGILAVLIAVGLFMVLPVYITKWVTADIRNDSLIAIIEGGIRLGIFLIYIIAISLLRDIRRVYMYHGAEHKCINCIERGRPLTVKNVMRSSRLHKRCGTSFLLFVVVVSIIVFFFIRVDNMALKVLLRIALIPVIAGISYEILRLAGRYDNIFVNILSAPGMLLQMLTTREPDEDMVEVAICAVEAVFDWKKFQSDEFGYNRSDDETVKQEEEHRASIEKVYDNTDELPQVEVPEETQEAGTEYSEETGITGEPVNETEETQEAGTDQSGENEVPEEITENTEEE